MDANWGKSTSIQKIEAILVIHIEGTFFKAAFSILRVVRLGRSDMKWRR